MQEAHGGAPRIVPSRDDDALSAAAALSSSSSPAVLRAEARRVLSRSCRRTGWMLLALLVFACNVANAGAPRLNMRTQMRAPSRMRTRVVCIRVHVLARSHGDAARRLSRAAFHTIDSARRPSPRCGLQTDAKRSPGKKGYRRKSKRRAGSSTSRTRRMQRFWNVIKYSYLGGDELIGSLNKVY